MREKRQLNKDLKEVAKVAIQKSGRRLFQKGGTASAEARASQLYLKNRKETDS